MASVIDSFAARALRSRRVVRAPIWLFRHGLGWLLGTRVLMLEHVGRRSGQSRYVCLEVVERPREDRIVVVSGFGEQAQWFQNLAAHPECRVSIGRHTRLAATSRRLSSPEAEAVLARYRAAHPRAWRRLRGAIEHAVGREVEELPMMELALRLEP